MLKLDLHIPSDEFEEEEDIDPYEANKGGEEFEGLRVVAGDDAASGEDDDLETDEEDEEDEAEDEDGDEAEADGEKLPDGLQELEVMERLSRVDDPPLSFDEED